MNLILIKSSFEICECLPTFIFLGYCSSGAWKLPSGKYVCFVDPAISHFNAYYEIFTKNEDPQTGMNRLCTENGFDHIIEPRTHEDAVMFTKLEHCIESQKLKY